MIVYLGLGSNLGDRETFLSRAVHLLEQTAGIILHRCSSIIESEPWRVQDQPCFLNQIVEIETTLSPENLLESVKQIEQQLGRQQEKRWGPRRIDVDILLYGDLSIREEGLQIPHPEIKNRRFVLAPLAELIPEQVIPGTNQRVQTLLNQCPDQGRIRPWHPALSGETIWTH